MAGTLKVGGKVLATHNSETDEISLDSATNTSNLSFPANHAGIKTALNASGDAPIYACRAWVNFNGIGTVAIRASGNVSSITDNATGDYTVNFTTAITDVNYAVSGTPASSDNSGRMCGISTKSTGSVRVLAHYASNTGATVGVINVSEFNIAIFR